MMQLFPTDLKIDFLKISKPFAMASTIFVVLSLVGLFTKGLNLGIDFTGGAETTIKVPATYDIGKVRETLKAGGLGEPTVVQLGTPEDHEFLVKVQASEAELKSVAERVDAAFKTGAGEGNYQILKSDVVGPAAGEKLKESALLSIFYAAIGILLYITMRFDLRFAPGIVRALLLDVVIVVGVWVLLQKEFTLTVVAALLTVAGYSCNDTIVIYDRIREYSKLYPNWSIEQIINKSININLGRTFLTVICTLFVVVSLWLFGGPVLEDFAFAMLIGFTVSVYSTIFVANPMIVFMEKRRLARQVAMGTAAAAAARR